MPEYRDLIQAGEQLEGGDYDLFMAEAEEVLGPEVQEEAPASAFDVFAPTGALPNTPPGPIGAPQPSQAFEMDVAPFEALQRPSPGLSIDVLSKVGYPHINSDPSGANLRSWLRRLVRQM